MKKSLVFGAALIFAAMLSVNVTAAPVSTDILKGTPVIDGALDDIYTQSASYELDNFGFYCWGDVTEDTGTRATAYFLWDSDYLYFAAAVTDATSCSSGGEGNWQNDAVESWFTDNDSHFKIHASADGLNFFVGADGDGAASFDFSAAKYKAVRSDGSYVIECAYPLSDLAEGRKFSYTLQIDDITTDTIDNGCASGSQTSEYEFTLSSKEVAYPVVIEETPEAAPAEEAPVTESADTQAPAAAQTSDMIIPAAVIMAAAIGGYILLDKKYKH